MSLDDNDFPVTRGLRCLIWVSKSEYVNLSTDVRPVYVILEHEAAQDTNTDTLQCCYSVQNNLNRLNCLLLDAINTLQSGHTKHLTSWNSDGDQKTWAGFELGSSL